MIAAVLITGVVLGLGIAFAAALGVGELAVEVQVTKDRK